MHSYLGWLWINKPIVWNLCILGRVSTDGDYFWYWDENARLEEDGVLKLKSNVDVAWEHRTTAAFTLPEWSLHVPVTSLIFVSSSSIEFINLSTDQEFTLHFLTHYTVVWLKVNMCFVVPLVFIFLCRTTADKRAVRRSTTTSTDTEMVTAEGGNSGRETHSLGETHVFYKI